MKYQNIEIGTSDFRTLIATGLTPGISVEPIKPYFDNLPDRDGWIKVNCAIGKAGTLTAYYVDPAKITDEPRWVRGCNMMGKPHPTIQDLYPHLIASCEVESITVAELLKRHDVTEIGFLKIDTEGMDCQIVSDFLESGVPCKKIQFEANILTDKEELEALIPKLKSRYRINAFGDDIVCHDIS